MRVLYIGSGAVNLTLAGWMHSSTSQTSFLVSNPQHELIRTQAFQCQLPGDRNFRVYRCKAVHSLEGMKTPDLIIFGVKSHLLHQLIDQVKTAFGTDVTVASVLNGVKHVELLREAFAKCVFLTIGHNAYRTSDLAAVAMGGSVVVSSFGAEKEADQLHAILKRKISTDRTLDPMAVAHCKLIMNLNNALLTLVQFHHHRERDLPVLQQLVSNMIWEGVRVIRKHGVKEVSIPGAPSWLLVFLSRIMPQFIALPIFKKRMAKYPITSMAQDLEGGARKTEVEDINGYFLELADGYGVDVPYNRAIYSCFKEWVESGMEKDHTPSDVLGLV